MSIRWFVVVIYENGFLVLIKTDVIYQVCELRKQRKTGKRREEKRGRTGGLVWRRPDRVKMQRRIEHTRDLTSGWVSRSDFRPTCSERVEAKTLRNQEEERWKPPKDRRETTRVLAYSFTIIIHPGALNPQPSYCSVAFPMFCFQFPSSYAFPFRL